MAAKIEAKGYGKNFVRVMRLRREGDVHFVSELSLNVELELSSEKDYLFGDNASVVATDSQKNTLLVLAKRYGIKTPEEFTLLVVDHFLKTYPQVK
jgi:urate oxidase